MRASLFRFKSRGYCALVFLISLGCAGIVYSQEPIGGTTTPGDHPELRRENRLEEAARLTALVAKGDPTGDPAAVPRQNLIDEHIFGRMEADGIPNAPPATDEEFFRRIHLDLIGRIGDPDALAEFQSSNDPEKRAKLIDQLVGSKPFLQVIEPGWHGKRSIYPEDIATTIYSALGIDWTKSIQTTPSGRTFYYVEPFSATNLIGRGNQEVTELFG